MKQQSTTGLMIGLFGLVVACQFVVTAAIVAAPQEDLSEEALAAMRPYEPDVQVVGKVTDQAGQPQANADVTFHHWLLDRKVKTDAKGRFEIYVPQRATEGLFLMASTADGQQMGATRLSWEPDKPELGNVKIQIQPAREVVIDVQDEAGQPVTDATVGVIAQYDPLGSMSVNTNGRATILIPADQEVECVFTVSKTEGVDYRVFVLPREQRSDANAQKPALPEGPIQLVLGKTKTHTIKVLDDDGKPVAGVDVYPWLIRKAEQADSFNVSSVSEVATMKTNDAGIVRFDWMPDWPPQYLSFSVLSKEFTSGRADFQPKSESDDATIVVSKKILVKGLVTDSNGSPAVDLRMRFHGRGLRQGESSGMSESADVFTNGEGRFEMWVAPYQAYVGQVQDEDQKFATSVAFVIKATPPEHGLELTVRKPTRLFGRLSVGPEKKPMAEQQIWISHYAELVVPILGGEGTYSARPTIGDVVTTDKNGRYEIPLGSGMYWIRGTSQNEVTYVTIEDETEKEVNFHATRPENGTLIGRVVKDSDGSAVAGAKVHGVYSSSNARGRDLSAETTADGAFEVERELLPCVVSVKTEDGKLATIVVLEADDSEIEFRLVQTVTASGRLVDTAGKPLTNEEVSFGRRVYLGEPGDSAFSVRFGQTLTTDAEGKFNLVHLVPGTNYHVNLTTEKKDGMAQRWALLTEVQPEPGETKIELGDIVYEERVRSAPLTTEQKIARAFGGETVPLERLKLATTRAGLTKQLVLILLARPEHPHTQQFGKLQFEDNEVRQLLHGFVTMAVDTSDSKFDVAKELAAKFEVELQQMDYQCQMILADQDGQTVAHVELAEISRSDADELQIDKEKLLNVLTKHTPKPLDAQQLLDDALAAARQQDKRVIVQETATWCGPCIKLSRYLDRTREIWSEDFIWVKMDHRWTGARDIMTRLRDGADGGVPWFAILDADGKVLETCNDTNGDNIGFPSGHDGRKYFRSMIQRTAQRLTRAQIDKLISSIDPKP